MKNTFLAELLRSEWIGPVASLALPACASGGAARWTVTTARLRHVLGNNIDAARVMAMQAAIEAGCYAPDADEVANGVLAAIAPTRRH
jgi:Anti-sigma-28 factor, FlgM